MTTASAPKPTLVVCDNPVLLRRFEGLVRELELAPSAFVYACSPGSEERLGLAAIDVTAAADDLAAAHALIISLHCVQIFPMALVRRVRCVNVHPGYNPHNRGWYPHVFSIVNGLPAGATIHEMDERTDHGRIIARTQVPVHEWDTSGSLYERIVDQEIELLRRHLPAIIAGSYSATGPESEGNLQTRADYAVLCRLDPAETTTMRALLARLRALSHDEHWNAYYDTDQGKRIFVRLQVRDA